VGEARFNDYTAVILAGGNSKRMKSNLPKAMFDVCGKPMIGMVYDAVARSGVGRCVVVTGFGADGVVKYLGDKVEYAYQDKQLGTGHALLTALEYLAGAPAPDARAQTGRAPSGHVLVLYGDMPLISVHTLTALMERCAAEREQGVLVSAEIRDKCSYGRVLRDACGAFRRIVELKDATEAEARVTEMNIGVYCFEAAAVMEALRRVTPDNAQGEIYLTDALAEILRAGGRVGIYKTENEREHLGANDRVELAELNRIRRDDICNELMLESGVTIIDKNTTYVDSDVTIGMDTTIYPGCVLERGTVIGENCEIGPNTRIANSSVGDGSKVAYSVVTDAAIGESVTVGPFAHLRPGAAIGNKTKIGDYVEIKNAVIGERVSISHLAYIGDADVGDNVNIGCGAITCNYDGKLKHRTTIGSNAFIGSNANLIAPVTVHENAYVASGSTITDDVPEDALAIARGRQVNKENWVSRKGLRRG